MLTQHWMDGTVFDHGSGGFFTHEALTARGESRTGEKNGDCHQFAPVSVPDSRLLAFTAGKQEAEVWVMENFLPELGVGKPD